MYATDKETWFGVGLQNVARWPTEGGHLNWEAVFLIDTLTRRTCFAVCHLPGLQDPGRDWRGGTLLADAQNQRTSRNSMSKALEIGSFELQMEELGLCTFQMPGKIMDYCWSLPAGAKSSNLAQFDLKQCRSGPSKQKTCSFAAGRQPFNVTILVNFHAPKWEPQEIWPPAGQTITSRCSHF